jgi:cytochrome c-type biogenesis protein CcmH/NrfG
MDYCFECDEFPCLRLHPAADKASFLTHNLKIYNLCQLMNQGPEAFIELSPENNTADYLNTLARFYLESKKYEKALDALTDPRSLGSGSLEKVLLDLVEKSKNSEPKLAEAALERVIKADPANAETYFTLGRMYYADGKEMDSRTKELLTKYVEIGQDPNNVGQAKDMLTIVDRRSK